VANPKEEFYEIVLYIFNFSFGSEIFTIIFPKGYIKFAGEEEIGSVDLQRVGEKVRYKYNESKKKERKTERRKKKG
jgi:hypothetical protein